MHGADAMPKEQEGKIGREKTNDGILSITGFEEEVAFHKLQ